MTSFSREIDRSSGTTSSKKPRLPYESPHLVEYGSVAKLTQSGAGSGGDGGPEANMMMVCL